MVFGNWIFGAMPPSRPGSTSAAPLPTCFTVTATYSPFGVSTRRTAETSTPLPAQKPTSALVGLPSASNAAFVAGPIASSSKSFWRSATSVTSTVRRRGVP